MEKLTKNFQVRISEALDAKMRSMPRTEKVVLLDRMRRLLEKAATRGVGCRFLTGESDP